MRLVIQRVASASVTIVREGGAEAAGAGCALH